MKGADGAEPPFITAIENHLHKLRGHALLRPVLNQSCRDSSVR